jgi:hypothetical protein
LKSWEVVPWVNGENHALLAVASLATEYPDGVLILHLELGLLERPIGVVCCHGDAEKKNQIPAERRGGKVTYKLESKPPGRGVQGCWKVDCVTL